LELENKPQIGWAVNRLDKGTRGATMSGMGSMWPNVAGQSTPIWYKGKQYQGRKRKKPMRSRRRRFGDNARVNRSEGRMLNPTKDLALQAQM
jgi:hypothetical protein